MVSHLDHSELFKLIIYLFRKKSKEKIWDKVTVEFTIDVNGYVSDGPKVTNSVSAKSLDKEALRIIESMPRWKSGMQLGRPVAVRMSVPINFLSLSKTTKSLIRYR